MAATTDCERTCAYNLNHFCSCFEVTYCEAVCDNISPSVPANYGPTLDPGLSDQTINTGSPTPVTLPPCTDPEGAACSFLEGSTPSFGLFDPESRTYTFNPVSGNEGPYSVTF